MKRITERLDEAFSGTEVDATANVVRNVSLLGLDSKNGYRYAESAARKAVTDGLYDNAHVYADHAPEGATGPRGVPELVGKVLGKARFDESRKRVVADVRIIKASPLGPMFLEMASDPDLSRTVGMSHDCDGDLNEATKTVTAISRVHSVDFVTRPATTGGIHEHTKEPKDMDEKEAKELREQLDAAKKANEAAAKALKEANDAREAADKAAAELREQVAKRETLALVESESADLPESARESLREDFKDRAEKPEVVKAAVSRIRKVLEGVGAKNIHGAPITAAGPRFDAGDVKPGEDAKLLESVIGRFAIRAPGKN